MRPLSLRIIFELVLGAVLIAFVTISLHQWRRIAEYQRRQEADAQTLRLLREALRQKELQKAPEVTELVPSGDERDSLAKKEAIIEQLDRELAESHSAIADLQTQLSAARDQSAQAQASAEERRHKQQVDAQAQLDDLQKKLDAALTESDIARHRVAALEADNAKLKTDSAAGSTRATEVAQILASLQDLDRRRDIYLTSILRRYRDITGEFRAMSSMLDTSHDPSSGACSEAALTRIQNAVTSAEDDMRQLTELNARSQKLEKQLLKK